MMTGVCSSRQLAAQAPLSAARFSYPTCSHPFTPPGGERKDYYHCVGGYRYSAKDEIEIMALRIVTECMTLNFARLGIIISSMVRFSIDREKVHIFLLALKMTLGHWVYLFLIPCFKQGN